MGIAHDNQLGAEVEPADDDVLIFDAATGRWVPGPQSGGGGDTSGLLPAAQTPFTTDTASVHSWDPMDAKFVLFPTSDGILLAAGVEGDAFPRIIIHADPGWGITFGDGTIDPDDSGAYISSNPATGPNKGFFFGGKISTGYRITGGAVQCDLAYGYGIIRPSTNTQHDLGFDDSDPDVAGDHLVLRDADTHEVVWRGLSRYAPGPSTYVDDAAAPAIDRTLVPALGAPSGVAVNDIAAAFARIDALEGILRALIYDCRNTSMLLIDT